MDFFNFSTTVIASIISTSGLLAFVLWIFKRVIASWLWKEHSKEIEQYKVDLQLTTELLKHDLQKDFARTELYSNSLFTIYPELYSKLILAQGVVGGFTGFRSKPNWEGFDKRDFESLLVERDAPSGAKNSILELLSSNRDQGIKKLEEFLHQREFGEASEKLVDFKNYLLLKRIFIPKDIASLCFEINKKLVSIKIDASLALNDNTKDYYSKMNETMKDIEEEINKLLTFISIELNPPAREKNISK